MLPFLRPYLGRGPDDLDKRLDAPFELAIRELLGQRLHPGEAPDAHLGEHVGVDLRPDLAVGLGLAELVRGGLDADPHGAAHLVADRGVARELVGELAEVARSLARERRARQHPGQREQPIDRARLRRDLGHHAVEPTLVVVADHGEREIELRGEVEVEAALREAGPKDDLVQGGARVPVLGEDRGRRVEDLPARSPAPLRPGRRPCLHRPASRSNVLREATNRPVGLSRRLAMEMTKAGARTGRAPASEGRA